MGARSVTVMRTNILVLFLVSTLLESSHALEFKFPTLGIRPPGVAESRTEQHLRGQGPYSRSNEGSAGISRSGLAFATAQTSFDSPDKFAKNQGALAQWLGTSDLPVDNMFIFGSLGFVVGYAKSKMSRFLIAVGLLSLSVLIMSKNGYVTVNWGKVQRDVAGSETYKMIKSGKAMQLLPPNVQDAISRWLGVVKSAIENNKGGLAVALSSFLSGMAIGSRA